MGLSRKQASQHAPVKIVFDYQCVTESGVAVSHIVVLGQDPDGDVVTTQWCQKGLSNTKSEKIIIPKSPLRRSGDLIYHRYDSI